MYANDVLIYEKATLKEAQAVCNLLRQYSTGTGQALNWEKSTVHFSSNVRDTPVTFSNLPSTWNARM